MNNLLKQKLKSGELAVGTIVTMASPTITEIISNAGYDFIWFDMEHSALSFAEVQNLLQVINGVNISSVIRVPRLERECITKALDIGADAIIIPNVESSNDVKEIIKYAKYSPIGNRGVGVARAQSYGSKLNEYIGNANSNIQIILQIESKNGVENISSILEVGGIDGVFIGPYDLSSSLGCFGEFDNTDFINSIEKVKQACKFNNCPIGIFVKDSESVALKIEEGFKFIVVGTDVGQFSDIIIKTLSKVRQI